MPLNLPNSSSDVATRSKVDVQRELRQSDPFLKNHWLLGIVVANANRVYDFYLQLTQAIKLLFLDTATGDYLTRWAAIWGKSTLPATKATGNIVVTGLAGYSVSAGTTFATSGVTYSATAGATLASQSVSISSLTRSGSTVTAVATSSHGLSNNVEVSISGAAETEYNEANAEITVIDDVTFTYEITGSPSTPATGTILAAYVSATVSVESDDFGADQNLDAGTLLKLQSPIAGVSDSVGVDAGAIGGGTDQEDEESLRARTLSRIQNPIAHFSEFDIVDKAQEIAGVTRVFVETAGTVLDTVSILSITRTGDVATVTTATDHDMESGDDATIAGAVETDYNGTFAVIVDSSTVFYYIVSGTPTTPATGTITAERNVPLGTVNVYFTRDNDDSLIPSGSEVTTVKNKLLEIIPANTSSDDLVVAAPVAVITDFVFSDLTPNTASLRTSVTANLQQFFRENTTVGQDIDQDAYRAAIFNSVDESTGAVVQTFSLSSPSADITIGSGEIGILGNITYP